MQRLLPLTLTAALAAPLAARPAQDLEVGMRAGQVLPDIELPLIDGSGSARLSELRGKKLLLVTFASW
jgi:hypothetical protein